MLCLKIKKKELLKLLNWNENWKWNMNKVKGVNKMRTGKKKYYYLNV